MKVTVKVDRTHGESIQCGGSNARTNVPTSSSNPRPVQTGSNHPNLPVFGGACSIGQTCGSVFPFAPLCFRGTIRTSAGAIAWRRGASCSFCFCSCFIRLFRGACASLLSVLIVLFRLSADSNVLRSGPFMESRDRNPQTKGHLLFRGLPGSPWHSRRSGSDGRSPEKSV